jgi:TonB-dependent SusC/RagA subfamily outer membrane receptor
MFIFFEGKARLLHLITEHKLKISKMKSTALIAIIVLIASTVHSQTRVVHGQLTAFNSFAVKNVEITSKKVNADTESVTMNLQFIDSEENREMAVGYGYISKKNLTYGVSHLEHEDMEFCSYSNIFDLIQGQLSGVTVRGDEIYVRGGTNSFTPGATMALYVVDNQPTSSLDWIQPCQIKSINVLKDSNAAIYGSRGGNGVVLIETLK